MTKIKRARSLEKKRNVAGYVFILPFIIGVTLMFIPMLIQVFRMGFADVLVGEGRYTLRPAGFAYYIELFTKDAWFMQLAATSIKDALIDFVCILFFSFFIAVLLNQKFHGRSLARVIFFLPVILVTGVVAKIDAAELTSTMGSMDTASIGGGMAVSLPNVSDMLRESNVLGTQFTAVIEAVIGRMGVMTTGSGVQILLFLSGLQAISPSVYEAAAIEGCSGWETFWKVTLPMMSPIILLNSIYTLIDTMTNTNNPVVSALLNATNTQKYSYAAARSSLYLLIVGLLVGLIFLIGRKLVYYRE